MANKIISFKKIRVLLEMRPALDGFAGIPQETRLLFRNLCVLDEIQVIGLLQTSLHFLDSGLNDKAEYTNNKRLNYHSRVFTSLTSKPSSQPVWRQVINILKRTLVTYRLALFNLLFSHSHQVKIFLFNARYFENDIWRALFAKTLPIKDFNLVTSQCYMVCSTPRNILQRVGINFFKWGFSTAYPILDTQDVDVFITQTPYPARVSQNTTLVVRYHDALPILMPHMFESAKHQLAQFYNLANNVQSGAYFACASETTRQDLLQLFPEVSGRAVTIHNMVSHHFHEEDSCADQVAHIVRFRINQQSSETHPQFNNVNDQISFYKQHLENSSLNYLLMVSTIEPRKNHCRLIAAWEIIHTQIDPSLKLIVVGNLGWDTKPIINAMRVSIDQGAVFLLNNVPADELRILYRHAKATICPSLAEGFDFSGIEAMCSGGIVIASDIPVHKEIYAHAAEYFCPHSTTSLVNALKNVLYDANAIEKQITLRTQGKEVSQHYLPDTILPKWKNFLKNIKANTAHKNNKFQ